MLSVFCCIPSGSRYGNGPNELVHRAGPPFLDNHYRDYQYTFNTLILNYVFKLESGLMIGSTSPHNFQTPPTNYEHVKAHIFF